MGQLLLTSKKTNIYIMDQIKRQSKNYASVMSMSVHLLSCPNEYFILVTENIDQYKKDFKTITGHEIEYKKINKDFFEIKLKQ